MDVAITWLDFVACERDGQLTVSVFETRSARGTDRAVGPCCGGSHMCRRARATARFTAIVLIATAAASLATVSVMAQAVKGGNPKAAAIVNPVKPTPDSIRKGRQQYQRACRHCHGVTGVGDGPLAPKNPSPANLTDDKWDYGASDGEVFSIIANGVGGSSEMKGHRSEITTTEMWNIVNFLRTIGPTPPK